MLEIKEIIDGLKNIKLDVSEDMLEDYAPIEVATLEEIVDFEEKSGIILPNS